MTTRVANVGLWERTTSGQRNTNLRASFGSEGTIRTTVEGIEYVFGPGEVKSFSDDGLAAKIAASNAKLRIADDREGNWKSNASLSVTRW